MTVTRLATIALVGLALQAPATGEITGVVMSGGPNAAPIRRAVVSISGGALTAARSAITDDAGRFSFARLPAGSFRLVARKAAYLQTFYGATRPGQEGSAIALAAGQRVDVTLTMFKGAVIAGVVRDPAGRPLVSVPVSVVDLRSRGQGVLDSFFGIEFVTDDRGAYRIYGLLPGDYLVAAGPLPGDVAMRSAADTDAMLAALTQRQRTPAAPPLSFAPATPARFAAIYHPATPFANDAARVRVGAGEERSGVDITVAPVRAGTIEGTVSGTVANLGEVEVGLIAFGPRVGRPYDGMARTPPDASGKFAFRNVPPGRYRVVARAKAGPVNPNDVVTQTFTAGGSAGGARNIPATRQVYVGELLFAAADVDMRGQDAAVSLSLQPGGSIAGRVVFEGAATPPIADLSTVRIGMSQAQQPVLDNAMGVSGTAVHSVETVSARPDATFQLNGIGPMIYQLYANLPAAQRTTWTLRSALVDGRDLLDEVVDGANTRLSGVTLTFSNQPTTLSGTLQMPSGQPASQYFVVIFAADRRHWREGSRRSQSVRPATDGRFTFAELPAGDYLLAALTDVEPGDWQRPEFLEQVAASAVKVSIAWGERKVQDLRIR